VIVTTWSGSRIELTPDMLLPWLLGHVRAAVKRLRGWRIETDRDGRVRVIPPRRR
jgi:hypothetical protein